MNNFIDNIIHNVKRRKLKTRVFMMIISLFISAIVFNIFILRTNIVAGGINGISIITENVYGYNPTMVILGISILCLILSFMYLGIEKTTGTILSTLLYPILIKLTYNFTSHILIDTNDLIVISIYIGILTGLANGIMYKTGFSNGGLPIINQILYEKFKIPISISSFIINGIIIIIGGIYFGITMLMYAIIILYINSIIINKILLGISNNKAFYIITTHDKEIKDYVIKSLNHSVTIFDVEGAFFHKKRKVLLTVVPTREYYRLTEGIKMIDKDSFFVVTDAYEVSGGK